MKQTYLIITLFLSLSLFSQTQEKKDYKELIATLDSIHHFDQVIREQSREMEKEFAWDSEEIQNLWRTMHLQDSINLIKVEKIISEYGWLGADDIGKQGSTTIFLVIQHADIATQEKYLPILQDAVDKGNARGSDLALMKDRVLLGKGQKQVYGSQLEADPVNGGYRVSAITDPDMVDLRRKDVGLGTMSEYLKIWDLKWDLEAFKKRMEFYDLEKEGN